MFEVGDVADDEAVNYLIANGVPAERAAVGVRDITGGRLIYLSQYLTAVKRGKGDDGFKKELHAAVRVALHKQHLPDDHELFRKLLVGAVDVGEAPEAGPLVTANILAEHADKTYTFYSRTVQRYFETQIKAADELARPALPSQWEWAWVRWLAL